MQKIEDRRSVIGLDWTIQKKGIRGDFSKEMTLSVENELYKDNDPLV